ncbi:MAG: hypothetical protein ACD_3C00106G0006 [uncultured bacterium (gcode 4)]|uniref:AMMECR1 domain-containing protein n=1 Tax=uncultured bacterium (gcode 4) TaxID=1234023 RepID=K2G1F7_9BACT|nr:MAG: hypothetical protein ACD_3C00106G0006 [uncultured bacterium (gcode 4)]
MHTIAKKVIEMYLNEQKIPTIDELWVWSHPENLTKKLSFVTLYKDGKIIASSWRINAKKANTIAELIENALFCLKDPRFIEAIKNPLEIRSVKFRVDIIADSQRRILNSIDEFDITKNWAIILSQTLWKAGVILPNIANLVSTPRDLFELVCRKADIDPSTVKEEDYYLYAIESDQYNDF